VDAKNDDLNKAWSVHGSPKLDPSDHKFLDLKNHPYKQGNILSHMSIWKHMIDNDIPWAFTCEDDIVFHKDWKTLAPAYFNATPKNYDLCYVGHHCGCGRPYNILKVPVYCNQATIVTNEGAKKIYHQILNDPNGVRTNDCMLYDYMIKSLQNPAQEIFNWYAWNAEMFPDKTANKHPQKLDLDVGLAFQENLPTTASYE
jgi:GR25 family glycosyltransferase involved in LPS biosynthesis